MVFYFGPEKENYDTEEEAIIQLIKIKGTVSAKQVAEYFAISHNTAIRKLNLLITQKHVKKQGKGAAVKYATNAQNN